LIISKSLNAVNMKPIFFILILSVLTVSCGKNDTTASCPDAHPDCSGINCLLNNKYFDFRIIDKNTGADLVFGQTPRYTIGDIALYADIGRTQPIGTIADSGAKLFKADLAMTEMYLVIAGTTTYKITAAYRVIDCCSSRVKDLSVNGQSLCTCCADAIQIPVD
jgi:hypothetical protein